MVICKGGESGGNGFRKRKYLKANFGIFGMLHSVLHVFLILYCNFVMMYFIEKFSFPSRENSKKTR